MAPGVVIEVSWGKILGWGRTLRGHGTGDGS
jgi:hypothetical protein